MRFKEHAKAIIINRTELYGKPVRERWAVSHDDGSTEYSVEVYPEEGSLTIHDEETVPKEHVPDHVLETFESELSAFKKEVEAAVEGGYD